jgi:restriction system protein
LNFKDELKVARRRRESWLDVVAALPWPVGIALGVAAFVAIRFGVPWYFNRPGSDIAMAVSKGLAEGPVLIFSWIALLLCWVGAGLSYVKQRQRAELFDTQAKNLQLSSLDWRQFERLVAEWFHRQGYQVAETGGGGPDGGIDLMLRKDGRAEIVQCKHWRSRQVTVATVREMWGLMQHHGASAVWIVCTGEFTPDAASFAQGKPIRLVSGRALGELIQPAAVAPPPPAEVLQTKPVVSPRACPRCGGTLVERQNRQTGDKFFGCESYPTCRGTIAMH